MVRRSGSPSLRRGARHRVDDEVAVGERPVGGVGAGAAARPPQHRPDAQRQLLHAERLADVVVGAGLEAGDAVVGVAQGGEHDDRHVRPVDVAQDAAHLQAAEAGQHHVEHDHVRSDCGGRARALGAAGGDLHRQSVALEVAAHDVAHLGVVLDDQHLVSFLGHRSPPRDQQGLGAGWRWRPATAGADAASSGGRSAGTVTIHSVNGSQMRSTSALLNAVQRRDRQAGEAGDRQHGERSRRRACVHIRGNAAQVTRPTVNVHAARSAQTQYCVGTLAAEAVVVPLPQHRVGLPPGEACGPEHRHHRCRCPRPPTAAAARRGSGANTARASRPKSTRP